MVTRKAEPVTKVWNSRTGSNYKNVGVLGWVIDVEQVGNKIELTTLNTRSKDDANGLWPIQFYHMFLTLIERKDEAAVSLLPGGQMDLLCWRPTR